MCLFLCSETLPKTLNSNNVFLVYFAFFLLYSPSVPVGAWFRFSFFRLGFCSSPPAPLCPAVTVAVGWSLCDGTQGHHSGTSSVRVAFAGRFWKITFIRLRKFLSSFTSCVSVMLKSISQPSLLQLLRWSYDFFLLSVCLWTRFWQGQTPIGHKVVSLLCVAEFSFAHVHTPVHLCVPWACVCVWYLDWTQAFARS